MTDQTKKTINFLKRQLRLTTLLLPIKMIPMICVAVAKIRKNLSLLFLMKEIFIFINAIFKQIQKQDVLCNLKMFNQRCRLFFTTLRLSFRLSY
jgi:hypothetical protein